jgi:hypothetical protein
MRLSVRKKEERGNICIRILRRKGETLYNNIKAHDVTIYFSRSSGTIY